MLLIFNETGFIEHAVLTGDTDRLKEIYEQNGKLAISTTETHDITQVYVENPTDEGRRSVISRPALDVAFDRDTVKADGIDEIIFEPAQPCKVAVEFNNATIAMGELASEPLEFSADQPGVYTLTFTPTFPVMPTIVYIEATA
jgi:hypothetical protein